MSSKWYLWAFLFIVPVNLSAGELTERIISQLEQLKSYKGNASFEVTLPMTDEDVHYDLLLAGMVVPDDSLSSYKYYIEIESDTHPSVSGNFLAYFYGNYYNFSNGRLREYHAVENVSPFQIRYSGNYEIPGVHQSGIFPGELPFEILTQLKKLKDNPEVTIIEHPDTLVEGIRSNALTVEEWGKGELLRSALYAFDKKTGLPIYKEIENNPGHLGSQTITTYYKESEAGYRFPPDYFTEDRLLQDKNQAMTLYRESNFKVHSLKGHELPSFSLPYLGREGRLSSEDIKGIKTVLLFLDTQGSFCTEALHSIDVLDRGGSCQYVVIMKEPASDILKQWLIEKNFSGMVLSNGNAIAGKLGITGYPVLIVTDEQGIVKEVSTGYDPEWAFKIRKALNI